jgi:hypothetical protein
VNNLLRLFKPPETTRLTTKAVRLKQTSRDDPWPLCCELWPGNTADVTTLLPAVRRWRQRFRVRKVCIVADRGMIGAETIAALESGELDCDYILGARMRSVKEVRERVLADRGRYREVQPPRQTAKDPSPLKVEGVIADVRSYQVRINRPIVDRYHRPRP